MFAFAFFSLALVCVFAVVVFQQYRSEAAAQQPEVLFETRSEPPFVRAIVAEAEADTLHLTAPVVHARLVAGILVLDVKSEHLGRDEGFEIAITEFDVAWLSAEAYKYHEAGGHLLVGPQGQLTDSLLGRVASENGLDLPSSAGSYVQAFKINGVVTDPNDFMVSVEATLPDGTTLEIGYDYASATVYGRVPTAALHAEGNYQPLQMQMATAR